MVHLFLVKHAPPDIEPNVPAKAWRLSEKGREQSALLAEALRLYPPSVVITSEEPKAAETGHIIAEVLKVPCHSNPGLHEQDATSEPYFSDPTAFEAAVKSLFNEPDKRRFENESANEALERFTQAVAAALEPYPKRRSRHSRQNQHTFYRCP